jgi:hypothetical protein
MHAPETQSTTVGPESFCAAGKRRFNSGFFGKSRVNREVRPRKPEIPLVVHYPRPRHADSRILIEELLQALEEVLLDAGVGVYEHHVLPLGGEYALVAGPREAHVLRVADQAHGMRYLSWYLLLIVVHDHDLEVLVARPVQGIDAPQGIRPGGVVDRDDRELHEPNLERR